MTNRTCWVHRCVFVWTHCLSVCFKRTFKSCHLNSVFECEMFWQIEIKGGVWMRKKIDHLASFAWQNVLTLWPQMLFWRIPFVSQCWKDGDSVKTSFLMKCFIFYCFLLRVLFLLYALKTFKINASYVDLLLYSVSFPLCVCVCVRVVPKCSSM